MDDPSFQAGLSKILEPLRERNADQAEIDEVTAQAWSFYQSSMQAGGTDDTQGDEIQQLSFAHLSELIQSGQPIPGIKEIPDVINDQQPSQSTLVNGAETNLKPWQR